MTPTETIIILRQYNKWRRTHPRAALPAESEKIGAAIDAAVEMIDRLEAAEKQTITITDALRSTAQTLAWMQHGKCRGFSDDLLTTNEALEKARAALEKLK